MIANQLGLSSDQVSGINARVGAGGFVSIGYSFEGTPTAQNAISEANYTIDLQSALLNAFTAAPTKAPTGKFAG